MREDKLRKEEERNRRIKEREIVKWVKREGRDRCG